MSLRRRGHGAEAAEKRSDEGLGLHLEDLRRQCGKTQVSLAEAMNIQQSALSHLERRDDILVSTLVDYIEALGGRLHIEARFRSGDSFKLLESMGRTHCASIDGFEESNAQQLALPTILGPEQQKPARDVVFSIRPAHAQKILDGTKTVELRRRFAAAVQPGTLALIYTTSPTSALTGFANIRAVEYLALSDLWKAHKTAACLGRSDFETYFSGLDRGYAIVLDSAKPLDRPVGLPELRKRFGFEPPQSYQYASPYMRGLVEHERS